MILLDSAAPLLTALQRLSYLPKTITPSAANAHILLDQVSTSVLELTAYGLDGSWMRQFLESTNTLVGIKYLFCGLDLTALNKRLSTKYGLQISEQEGELIFSTYENYVAGTNDIEPLDKISLRQYHGALSEFGPPVFLEEVSTTFKSNVLLKVLTELNAYGTYSKDVAARGIYLVVDVDTQTATFYGSQFECPNFYVRIAVDCQTTKSFNCVINGQHLDMLCKVDDVKSKSEQEITLTVEDSWMTVKGTWGWVNVPLLNPDLHQSITSAEFNFDRTKITQYAYRTFSAKRFSEALSAQEPNKEHANRHLEIVSQAEYLVLSKSADYKKKECSKVINLDAEALVTDFPSLLYNAIGLQQSTNVLDKFRSFNSTGSDELCLLVSNVVNKPDRWVITLKPIEVKGVVQIETLQVVRSAV